MTTIININVSSKNTTYSENDESFKLDLSESINLKNYNANIHITDFQTLNNLYNVTSRNDVFGISYIATNTQLPVTKTYYVDEGFYNVSNIVAEVKRLLDEAFIEEFSVKKAVTFNQKTLKFNIKINTPFNLSGSFCETMLNLDGRSVGDTPNFMMTSTETVDIYRNIQNINIIFMDLKTSNVSSEKDLKYESQRIGKIPISAAFGTYIVYQETRRRECKINETILNSFTLKLMNDNYEDILENNNWTMTIQLILTKKEELDKSLDDSKENNGGRNPPVITRDVSILPDARDKYIESFNKFKKLHKMYNIYTEKELKRMFDKNAFLKKALAKNTLSPF